MHAAGQLRTRDFVSILPFTDELVLLELQGAELLECLEVGVSSYPSLEGRFLQARDPERGQPHGPPFPAACPANASCVCVAPVASAARRLRHPAS